MSNVGVKISKYAYTDPKVEDTLTQAEYKLKQLR